MPISSVCKCFSPCARGNLRNGNILKFNYGFFCCVSRVAKLDQKQIQYLILVGQFIYLNMPQYDVICCIFFLFSFSKHLLSLKNRQHKKKSGARSFASSDFVSAIKFAEKRDWEKPTLISTNFQINARRLQKKRKTKSTVAGPYMLHLKIWREYSRKPYQPKFKQTLI